MPLKMSQSDLRVTAREDPFPEVFRASAKNKYTTLLVLWPVYCVASTGTYPQICTGGCALYTNQNTAQSCAFIFCRGPKVNTSRILALYSSCNEKSRDKPICNRFPSVVTVFLVRQEIVDMPDRQIDLFIRFCLQNNGRLSARKRASHFDFLSDEEIASLEQAVLSAYESKT